MNLFIYLFMIYVCTSYPLQDKSATVSQIDLVPTLSLLLGIPIPYGNLGTVIPELFCHDSSMDLQAYHSDDNHLSIARQVLDLIQRSTAFEINSKQVNRYLSEYASISGEISKSTLQEFARILHNATELVSETRDLVDKLGGHKALIEKATMEELARLHEKLTAVEGLYVDYLSQVKSLCQSLWAKFDLNSIFAGVSVLFLGVAVTVLILLDCRRKLWLLAVIPSMGCTVASVVTSFKFNFVIVMSLFPICVLVLGMLISLQKIIIKRTKLVVGCLVTKLSSDTVFAAVLCFLQCIALLSNSFVVNEDKLIAFFIQALIAVKCVKGLWKYGISDKRRPLLRQNSRKLPKKEHKRGSVVGFLLRLSVAWIAFDIVNRTAIVLKACREEQWSCVPTDFLKPLSSSTDKDFTASNRFILTVLCTGVIPLAVRQWLRYQGNLNGPSFVVLCVKFTLPGAFVLICAHWVLQMVPEKIASIFPEIRLWQQIILPQMVYCLCVATVACLVYSPVCLYTVFRGSKTSFSERFQALQDPGDNSAIIHAVVQEIKQNWHGANVNTNTPPVEEIGKDDANTPMVYGLATVYSSALLILFLAVALPLIMLLGNGMSLSVFLMCVQMFLLLEIHGLSHDGELGSSYVNDSGQW